MFKIDQNSQKYKSRKCRKKRLLYSSITKRILFLKNDFISKYDGQQGQDFYRKKETDCIINCMIIINSSFQVSSNSRSVRERERERETNIYKN